MSTSPVPQLPELGFKEAHRFPILGWPNRWMVGLLLLCATLPYVNALSNGFVYDDSYQVLDNPYIRDLHHLRQIFTTSVWSFRDSDAKTNYYRPMMMLGYLLCYKLFGLTPYGFHLVNLLLHIMVVLILFLLTARIFRDRALAFGTGALFALHPVHAESVAWVGAVTDLEMTFFYLLTFWFFLRMARPGRSRSEWMHLGMGCSFVLALLSKEQALTLPFLAAVYEYLYREDRAETSLGQKISRYGTLWLLAVAYVLLRIQFLGAFAPLSRFPDLTSYQALLSASALVGQYLWKLVWPAHLNAFYVFHKSTSLLDLRVLGGLGGLAFCVVLFMSLWKRGRMASFGLLWFLATLAPVLNPQWVGLNVFAERYLYLPSVGSCWVVAWGLQRLWRTASSRSALLRKSLVFVLSSLAVLSAVRIVMRNRDWQSERVLCTRTLAASPDAYPMLMNLGTVYAKEGKMEAAEDAWLRVLKLAPGNVTTLNNLGNLYLMQRRFWDAIGSFREAVQASPKSAGSHLNLGYAYTLMGLLEDAEFQLRAGVALAPQDSKGYAGLGVVYCLKGDQGRAESNFQRALSMSPSDGRIHFLLAKCYASIGRMADAAREYQAALALNPGNTAAVEGLLDLNSHHPETK